MPLIEVRPSKSKGKLLRKIVLVLICVLETRLVNT